MNARLGPAWCKGVCESCEQTNQLAENSLMWVWLNSPEKWHKMDFLRWTALHVIPLDGCHETKMEVIVRSCREEWSFSNESMTEHWQSFRSMEYINIVSMEWLSWQEFTNLIWSSHKLHLVGNLRETTTGQEQYYVKYCTGQIGNVRGLCLQNEWLVCMQAGLAHNITIRI